MLAGWSRPDLDKERQLELALVRLMEIVGEAAARVPEQYRQRYPEIPWRDIADLRNRLIHGYDEVDLDRLWTIVCDDLPPLIAQLERVLSADDPST